MKRFKFNLRHELIILGLTISVGTAAICASPQVLANDVKTGLMVENSFMAQAPRTVADVMGEDIPVSDFDTILADTIDASVTSSVVPEAQVIQEEQRKQAEAKAAEEARLAAQTQAVQAANWQQSQTLLTTFSTENLPADDIRQQIANYACSFAGWLPYVWAGASLQTGADCCGFTMAVYQSFGYNIARTVEGQAVQGRSVSLAEALPGDIVVYGGHVALYIGNGQVVHSPTPGQCVSITTVNMMPIWDIRRMIG